MCFSGAVQHIQIDKIIRILQDALILVALDIHSFVLVVGLYNMMIVRIQRLVKTVDIPVGDTGNDVLMLDQSSGRIALELRVVRLKKADSGIMR